MTGPAREKKGAEQTALWVRSEGSDLNCRFTVRTVDTLSKCCIKNKATGEGAVRNSDQMDCNSFLHRCKPRQAAASGRLLAGTQLVPAKTLYCSS